MSGAEVLAALETLSQAAGEGPSLDFHYWSERDLPWWVSIRQVGVSTPSGHFHTGALGNGGSAEDAAADLFRKLTETSGGEYAVVNPFGDHDGRRRATWVGDHWHIEPDGSDGAA
jgi:hypothetical protein